jgi:hypothetical protein
MNRVEERAVSPVGIVNEDSSPRRQITGKEPPGTTGSGLFVVHIADVAQDSRSASPQTSRSAMPTVLNTRLLPT